MKTYDITVNVQTVQISERLVLVVMVGPGIRDVVLVEVDG